MIAAALDGERHELHARPVDEVRVRRRVEHRRVGAASRAPGAPARDAGARRRRRRSPPAAPPRSSSACRARRARCRTPSTTCSCCLGCSSWRAPPWRRHRARGARRDTAGGSRSRSPGGTSPRCCSPASASMSASLRYVQWSAEAHPSSTASCTPGPCPSWLACSRVPESPGLGGGEHGAALVGVERALLAERVDPAARAGDGIEHLAADQVDVVVGAPGELGRHDVGGEQGRVRSLAGGDLEQPAFVVDGEAVARLDLDRRDAVAPRLRTAGGEPTLRGPRSRRHAWRPRS